MHLSCLEHGAYGLLLFAYYSNKGPLPDDDKYLANTVRLTLSDWSAVRPTVAQFFKQEGGKWIHPRAEIEIEKIKKLQLARSKGAASTNAKKRQTPSAPHSDTLSDTPSDGLAQRSGGGNQSHSQNAEREWPEANGQLQPKLGEVLTKADMIGLAKWKAEDWFNEMEGCGWIDHNKRPIQKWASVLVRVKSKWEADGRPKGPPAAKGAVVPATQQRQPHSPTAAEKAAKAALDAENATILATASKEVRA